jgi:hypothetical protein
VTSIRLKGLLLIKYTDDDDNDDNVVSFEAKKLSEIFELGSSSKY